MDYLGCFAAEKDWAWGWVYLSAVAALLLWEGEFGGVLRRAMAGMACEIHRKARMARTAIIMYASMGASLAKSNLAPKKVRHAGCHISMEDIALILRK
jgi:hypothetical protein